MSDVRTLLKKRPLLFDGGMGTYYKGAPGRECEQANRLDPEGIRAVHRAYLAAGADAIKTNTFGLPRMAAAQDPEWEALADAGWKLAAEAAAGTDAAVFADLGPAPDTEGLSAAQVYTAVVRRFAALGAKNYLFETLSSDTGVLDAVRALRETVPDAFVQVSFAVLPDGYTREGQHCRALVRRMADSGLVDAVGLNCVSAPGAMRTLVQQLGQVGIPLSVMPNAGYPVVTRTQVQYRGKPDYFASELARLAAEGVRILGGCCGTTPEFIRLLNGVFKGCVPGRPAHAMPSVLCTPMNYVNVDGITVVGERINPTGKKRFQQALRENDMNYVLEQAVSQVEAGAQVLDVNVGAPGVDEPALMPQVVKALQSVVSLPLQLDSSNVQALENGLRVYNGKPIVNSTNGEPEKLKAILPLCKKYGAAVVGLAIDERGILPAAEDRVAIARRITEAALEAGIPREDIYIDCLTLTASAQQKDVLATVQALEACKKELGVRTILGVSNISFGLPCRPYLNTTFLTMAMYAGLDLAIMNPSSEEMMAAVYSYNVLTNRDKQSMAYIARYADKVPASAALKQARTAQASQTSNTPAEADAAHSGPFAALMQAVEKGLKGEASARTHTLLDENEPLTLVDEALIPALDVVGEKYEKGRLFLPQLLQAASAAQAAFEEIKTAIAKRGGAGASKGRIVLATVKGDVHDIGKNIVRVILENYGFEVIDLGRDVPVETVVDTVREKDAHLVGLSALMTTTLKSMEETIAALHAAKLDCKIMVGGAVLTPEYAEKIGADWYAKDAKRSADIAKEFFGV